MKTGHWPEDRDAPVAGIVVKEPGFLDHDGQDYHLALEGPLVDAGVPDLVDPDGSPSDIDMYGGPYAGTIDLDRDGYPDCFWPGTLEDAPAGFNASDYDCGDHGPRTDACVE